LLDLPEGEHSEYTEVKETFAELIKVSSATEYMSRLTGRGYCYYWSGRKSTD